MTLANLFDVSAILIVLGAIFIYFGKIIADTKVEKYEKTDLIISGLLFVLIIILFPVIVNLFLYQKNWIFIMPSWIIILIQLIILAIYTKYYEYKGVVLKYEMSQEYNVRYKQKINYLVSCDKLAGKLLKKRPGIRKESLKLFDKIFKFFENNKVIFLVAVFILHTNIISLQTNNIVFISANFIFTFINFSLLAIAYGLSKAYHPKSKITLTNGKIISGKTLKYGDFIHIIDKDKKYFVNKDQVTVIEQSKFKEKWINKKQNSKKPK
ncbi:MAG: hypothetical protein ACTSX6_05095 [Candidatus Heimdallarchaeaceae archaeon]